MFLCKDEREMTKEYLSQGYIIRPTADRESLTWILKTIYNLSKVDLTHDNSSDANYWLNNIHKKIS